MSKYKKVKEGLVGISLSMCVKDILAGKVRMPDVAFIVCGVEASTREELFSRVLTQYLQTYWLGEDEKATAILSELWDTGRIVMPKLGHQCWPLSEDVRNWNSNGINWIGSVESFNDGTRAVPLYRELASRIQAVKNCIASSFKGWEDKHRQAIDQLIDCLPHGSGIDSSWKLEVEDCKPDRIVLYCAYHHMNDGGYYDGWTDFTVKIRPTFDGIDLQVVGAFPKKYADTRGYLEETLHMGFTQLVYWTFNNAKGELRIHTLERW